MNVGTMRAILLALFCAVVAFGCVGSKAEVATGWKTYRSPDYGFTIAYPASMDFFPGHPVQAPERSMFPICDDTTVACFQYNGNAFDETATGEVGISVNVLRDLKTETDCNSIDTGSSPIKTVKIHGTLFHYSETAEAGLGSGRSMTEYRKFYQQVCFEVAVVIAGRNVPPQMWKDEGFRPVNRRASRKIWNDLDRMRHSFAFVGTVKDGPDWNVYFDSRCGEMFEYPSAATVQEVVGHSNDASNSGRMTCNHAFSFKGSDYTVADKVDLRTDTDLDEWLSECGYPARGQMKILAQTDDFTEYSDKTYTYIRFHNDFFIFVRSGENRQPISSEGDQVFAHLTKSFRVR